MSNYQELGASVSSVGIVSIVLGLSIAISRAFLVVAPAATLRWFAERISTEARTRAFGASMLILPAAMIWAGASEDSGLAGVLLIFGLFILFAIVGWLWAFPRSYMEFCGAFLPHDENSSMVGWRVLGLLGVAIGLVFIYYGWLAL